jgi:uncharacterized integral membrane protein (TIGR00697 family)
VIFIACLLISNISSAKIIAVGPFGLPAAVLLFPVTYIVNDILSEVYGFAKARFAILLGFAANALMSVFFMLTVVLPYPPFYKNQDAYAATRGSSPRFLLASLSAFLVGSLINARIMTVMKTTDKSGRRLFLRCIASTLAGEALDSSIFITIGFIGSMPLADMLTMIAAQMIFKTVYEIIMYPVTSSVIERLKKHES